MKILVTHRNSTDSLVSLWAQTFDSVSQAKRMIERDASVFLSAHRVGRGEMLPIKFRQVSRWVKPKTVDYYMARGQDGTICYWQYFQSPAR